MGLATVIIKAGGSPPDPTCSIWFHLGLLHTILDERLGILRVTMKLLTSTALSLLLISLASVSYGQVETRNYPDGSVYVGEVRNGQRNGQGTFTFANGDVLVGEFRDGRANGQGTFTLGPGDFEGDVYVGGFRDSQPNGQGTYTFANGDVYVGEHRGGY